MTVDRSSNHQKVEIASDLASGASDGASDLFGRPSGRHQPAALPSKILRLRLFAPAPSPPSPPRVVRLLRGDVSTSTCDAIAVSANPYLEGTARKSHWRFAGRRNADGAVRAAGGRSLDAAVAKTLREIGDSLPLAPGSAVASRAGRSLDAKWVVHCVAPDALVAEAGDSEVDAALQATFAAALTTATTLGARSLALPAMGCGVRGFPRERAGAAALRAAGAWLRAPSFATEAPRLHRVDLVVFADDVWAAWPKCAHAELGPPTAVVDAEEPDSRGAVYEWRAEEDGLEEAQDLVL